MDVSAASETLDEVLSCAERCEIAFVRLTSTEQWLQIVLAIQGAGMQTSAYETPLDFCRGIICYDATVLRGNSQAIGNLRSKR